MVGADRSVTFTIVIIIIIIIIMNQEAINWERLDNPKGEAVLGVCRQSLKRDFGQTRFQLYTDSSWMHGNFY